jgi:deazaflavin-dependent oxidoreductase (nitroreductase family)
MRSSVKRQVVRFSQKYLANPPVALGIRFGVVPELALLETRGRKTGNARVNPSARIAMVSVVWIVAEHGRASSYVRNLMANPRARILLERTWRIGTAGIVEDDDPITPLASMGQAGNAQAVRLFGTDLLTVRIDLDEDARRGSA